MGSDLTAMHLNKSTNKCQTNPCASLMPVYLIKTFKDSVNFFGRNMATGIKY